MRTRIGRVASAVLFSSALVALTSATNLSNDPIVIAQSSEITGAATFANAKALCPPFPHGTVPVTTPAGGFGIDGDLQANTPMIGTGDWVPGPSGSGGSVLDVNGAPLTATTFHIRDPYSSASDNVFSSGSRVNDDPNTYTWKSGRAKGRMDINNVYVHFSTDSNGHLWIILSVDRLSNSGNACIDFEFLQNTLTNNPDGTFTSAGPNCGRTVGDFILTLGFTNGGTTACFFVSRWQASTTQPCGYDYVDLTESLPAGAVFAAVNTAPISVPFGAFGKTTYDVNTFAEAAVDVTVNACAPTPHTLFVKTKASTSSTATLEDFAALQLNAPSIIGDNLSPSATVGGLFVYQIVATNYPTSYEACALPSGLSVDHSLGLIPGIPSASGTPSTSVGASNFFGAGSGDLNLAVQPAPSSGPQITGSTSVTGRTGQPFTFEVLTTGTTSLARLSTTPLPPGLNADPVTGVISGTPTSDGNFIIGLTVADGPATAHSTLQLIFTADGNVHPCADQTVCNFPVFKSPQNVLLTPGQFFSYTMTADAAANFSYIGTDGIIHRGASSAGLPPGLSFDGVATISGTYTGDVNAPVRVVVGDSISPNTLKIRPPKICQLVADNPSGTGTQPLNFFTQ
jgi:hypothetical protein